MVERYARKEMSDKWTQTAKYAAWLKVELAAVKAWNRLGFINDDDCEKIVKNAKFDTARVDEIEKTTKHDVIAFLTNVSENLGDESRFLHYGMTSSDCIDTATALQMRDSLEIIIKDVVRLMEAIKTRAMEHKKTLMVGRSHGIHGEPITFGLVLAVWYDEISHSLELINHAKNIISTGKISGAMGNFAHAPLEFEEITCEILNLTPAPVSNQIIQRDRYAQVVSAIAILAASCEKIAVNLRSFQRTEIYEAEEFFSPGQKGSSAMPHKRNPVLGENVTGLCRILRSFVTPALENVALWHERDISHSSAERFILPDMFITADFMLNRLAGLIEKLLVYPENMMKNLNLTGGLVFSQRILLELPKKGISREDAYKIVQRNAMKVWGDLQDGKEAIDEKGHSLFLQNLLNDMDLKKYLSEAEIKACFDYDYYTKNVDNIFARVFK